MSPRRRRALGIFLGIAAAATVVALLVVPRVWLTSNDVTTGKHPGYPDLQPRRYDFSPDQTLTFVAAAAGRLPRWHLERMEKETGTAHLTVRTAIGGFTDDVTVWVTPTGADNDSSLVTIRSRSRIGGADLGENARHIRALQKFMDDRLPQLSE